VNNEVKVGSVKKQAPRLLKVKEAAQYLSISTWKIRRLIGDRQLPYLQFEAYGPFLLDVADLDAFIEANKIPAEF
jgi:excisionase family DNA binding protein